MFVCSHYGQKYGHSFFIHLFYNDVIQVWLSPVQSHDGVIHVVITSDFFFSLSLTTQFTLNIMDLGVQIVDPIVH